MSQNCWCWSKMNAQVNTGLFWTSYLQHSVTQCNLTVNGGSEGGCAVQCKGKWPSAPALCISMFTVPSALLCFDNLSSQNSPRKSYLVGLHKCMYTHT